MKTVCTIGSGLLHEEISKRLSKNTLFKLDKCDKAAQANEKINHADVCVFTFSAEQFAKLSEMLKSQMDRKVTICIVEGMSMEKIQTLLKSRKVVRVSTNIALKVGKSVSSFYAGSDVTSEEKMAVATILKDLGDVIEVESDEKIDAMAGLSTCGISYFYFLAQVLEQAAKKFNFNEDQAKLIAESVLSGSHNLKKATSMDVSEILSEISEKGSNIEIAQKALLEKDVHVKFLEVIKAVSAGSAEGGSFF